MAESIKASVFALVPEDTVGTLKEPTAATQFVPLRSGFTQEAAFETLESDELLNSIGASEPATGKETPTGSHPIYIKHSQVEGQEPEFGIMFESMFGAKSVNATEYACAAGSLAASSSEPARLKMGSDEEDNFELGQAVLIKDGANGYRIRNVAGIDSGNNELDMNFDFISAPASGVNLGKAVLYKPVSSGHPSFSAWAYWGNGSAKQSVAGCLTTSMTMSFEAGQFAVSDIGYDGTTAFFNPFVITASNQYIDFIDSSATTLAVQVTLGSYKTPLALAEAIEIALETASIGNGDDDITVSYNSEDGKFTIADATGNFSMLWDTGVNSANSIGALIGYDISADDAAAATYTSDTAIDLSAPLTPVFDNASNIVAKNAEFVIGNAQDSLCVNASTVEISIDSPNADVDSVCATSGVSEKVKESRSVSLTTTIVLNKYESSRFNALANNETVSAMCNFGVKDGSNNWEAGKCVNVYLPNTKITTHNLGGDNFITIEITLSAFVTSNLKDIYVNFL